MRKYVIIFFLSLFLLSVNIYPQNNQPITKGDFQVFIEMINQRFDDVNKRFDDLRNDINARFTFVFWIMGLGFTTLGFFSVFLFRLTNKRFEIVDKRFEQILHDTNNRFEQVNALILLLITAHEDEIDSEALDLTMGRLPITDITQEILKNVKDRIEIKEEIFLEKIMLQIKPIIINLVSDELAKRKST